MREKIYIVYVSAGAGHKTAALALYNYFKKVSLDKEINLVDVLEESNFIFKNLYISGYLFLIKYAAWLWRILFWLTSIKSLRNINNSIINFIDRINTHKFIAILIKQQPDIIISTHFLPSEISGYLKRKHRINSKLATVITDFGVHPFWLCPDTDIYTVAALPTKNELLDYGISKERIIETGIPVDSKFYQRCEKKDIRKKLGIDTGKFTVLISTGSFAIGPVSKIVESLYTDAQIIVICAKNKRLYRNLKAKNYPDVVVTGFVDNIQEFMAASDIAIIKPGGLTTAEILSMEITPIFICPIPGHETNNMKIMEEFGIGKFAKDIQQIKRFILECKQQPEKINQIKENIRKIRKTFAAKNIYDALC